jgi:hypothetical protein
VSHNPNTTEKFGLSSEALDALFARTTEQLAAGREAQQRAVEWPGQVESAIATLARELVTLRERVNAVEAAAKG